MAMPIQNEMIFDSTNDNYAYLLQQGGQVQAGVYLGMCGGLSTLWLKNMLAGVRDLLSKPDEGRAQLIQVKYRWDHADDSQAAVNLLASVGLTGVAFLTAEQVSTAIAQIGATNGAFLIWNGPHFVAAHVSPAKFYFYDCEDGLFRYGTQLAWAAKISSMGYGNQYPQPWTVWTVT
jgi:hypothetical protein